MGVNERPHGRKVATLVHEGKLVPAEIVVELIRKEIVESGAKHFVLDGFPRTLVHAKMFEKLVKKPAAAILLECPLDELENRVVKRGGLRLMILSNAGCFCPLVPPLSRDLLVLRLAPMPCKTGGRPDDNLETVRNSSDVFR